jgi:hypothetical protein
MAAVSGRHPRQPYTAAPADRHEVLSVPSTADRSFDEVFDSVADVAGWMTRDQARTLWQQARPLAAGDRIVEIGSYQGRSAIMLASAAPEGVHVTCIDPHGGNDRGPQEIEGEFAEGQADHEAFLANLDAAGVHDRVDHLRMMSDDAVSEVPQGLAVMYIDGAHRFAPAHNDIKRWSAKVRPGGTLLIHDSWSSVGVTLALLVTLVPGRRFRYLGRAQSMAIYQRADLGGLERVANAGRQLRELGWFVRNVVLKAAILAKAKPLYPLLRSDGTWPY